MPKRHAFNGRIIFDHLAKTAGQAVNAWLTNALGGSCVTENLIGNHQDLISRYGGEYSVISAHIGFNGKGLDPRYQYITCLREPIDRAVSWLYFVLNNHTAQELQDLWVQTEQFIITNGETSVPNLIGHINNPYVEHFSSIFSSKPRDNAEKLNDALRAIEAYDVWGLFEEMPVFLADIAKLIGLAPPKRLQPVNVTHARQAVDELSPLLRQRLEELNALDIEFYRILRERWQQQQIQKPTVATPEVAVWVPYDRDAVVVAAGTLWTDAILNTMGLNVEFMLPIQLHNSSPEPWISHAHLPIELSYHWLDQAGEPVVFDGERTPLPIGTIPHLHTLHLQMRIVTPDTPGQYQLMLLPVQGNSIWFDKIGFTPYIIELDITDQSAAQCYTGADVRFRTGVGCWRDGEIVSTGREGFLLLGPYSPLTAGQYEVKVNGFQEIGCDGGVTMDVAWANDSQFIPWREIKTDDTNTVLSITLPFDLTEDVNDLAVRIWVTAEVDVSVHSVCIRPRIS